MKNDDARGSAPLSSSASPRMAPPGVLTLAMVIDEAAARALRRLCDGGAPRRERRAARAQAQQKRRAPRAAA